MDGFPDRGAGENPPPAGPVRSMAEDDDSAHVLELFLLSADGVGMRRYNGVATRPETIAADIKKTALPH